MAHKLKHKNKNFTTNAQNKAKSIGTARLFNNFQFKSGMTTDTDKQEYEINDLYSREDESSNDGSADNGDVIEIESEDNVSTGGNEEPSYSGEEMYTEELQIQDECAICKKVFPTKHALVRHAHAAHPNGRAFKCKICKSVFSKLESVPVHVKAVHGSEPRPETCEFCSRSFISKSHLEKHKKSHSQERPFSCDQCDKNYKYRRNLLFHKKTHSAKDSAKKNTTNNDNESINYNAIEEDDEEDYAVDYDMEPEEYLEQSSSVNEVDINNGEYTYFIIDELNTDTEQNNEFEDDDDDVIFENATNEADSAANDSYLNSEPLKEVDQNECGVCFQLFNCQNTVLKHVHHEHPDTDIFKCPYCDDNFYHLSVLAKHVRIHKHLIKKNVCTQCFKSFDRGNDLRRHQLTHSDERPYLCDICNKGFKQRNHLKRHREILHEKKTQPLKYKCNLCPKNFSRPDVLKHHINSHYKKAAFSCSVCHKDFRSAADLDQHEEKHNHHKPFKCGFCPKSYDTNASLHRHFLTHSTVRNFTCSVCDRSFKERSHLKSHERIHYSNS